MGYVREDLMYVSLSLVILRGPLDLSVCSGVPVVTVLACEWSEVS